jgi:uncharacterized protein (DUF427 family)
MNKIILFAFFFLNLTSLLAQRFVVIEKNNASQSVFDYTDQYSLMGLLNNNIGILKDYIRDSYEYSFRDNLDYGLKDESELTEYETILNEFEKFVVRKDLKIPRMSDPEDTIIIVRTDQTLQVFLDSAIAADTDYESFLAIDRNDLTRWWEAANVGSIVKVRNEKQFCIKGIDLILIQINETSKIVHFCRSIKEGEKKHVVFSIPMDELLSIINRGGDSYYNGFNTLVKLSSPLSKEFYDNFRKKQFDAYRDCANVSYFGEDFNDFASLPKESKLMEQFDAGPLPIFEKEYRCQEQIGEVLMFPRLSDYYDSIIVVRTDQTLQVFLDSAIAADQDNETFLALDRDQLNSWWEQTKINDLVRKDRKEIIYWRDIQEPNAYAVMAWIDGKNSVRNLLFTRENKATSKESIILNFGSYNYSSDFTSIVKHKDIPSKKFDQLSWIKRMTNSKGQEFSIDKKNSKELTTYSYIIEQIIK